MDRIEFSDWELDEFISSAISKLGWTNPTEIQTDAIPAAIQAKGLAPEEPANLTVDVDAFCS